jgi:hypothetical protein
MHAKDVKCSATISLRQCVTALTQVALIGVPARTLLPTTYVVLQNLERTPIKYSYELVKIGFPKSDRWGGGW